MKKSESEVKITELIDEIKEGDVDVVEEEGKKLSRKERKQLYLDAVSGIDAEICVLEELLPNLPNSSDDYNQTIAQIKLLSEAKQILTKNHTELSKTKIGAVVTIGTTAAILAANYFLGPVIGTMKDLLNRSSRMNNF